MWANIEREDWGTFVKGQFGCRGIGLFIVEKSIKVYGGEIRSCNDNGDCFEFSLRNLDESE